MAINLTKSCKTYIIKLEKMGNTKIKKVKLIKNFVEVKRPTNFFATFEPTFSCSIRKKYVVDDLYQAEEKIEKTSGKKKKKWISILALVLNLCVIAGIFIYYGLTENIKSLSELLTMGVKWQYILCAVLAFAGYLIVESLKYFQLIKKTTGRYRWKLAMGTMIMGAYYDNITPLSSGGEPYQIYHLNKNGVPGEKATSIPLMKHIIWLLAFVSLGIAVLIVNEFCQFTTSILIKIGGSIALILNGSIVLLIFFFSISKRTAQILVIKVLKLLHKMHIIKNYKVTFFKVVKFVRNYQKTIKTLAKSVSTWIIQFLLAIGSYLSLFSIVYFIYLAFPHAIDGLSWGYIVCCMMLCELVTVIAPLPGGTGFAEFSFSAIFARLFSAEIIPWALIVWRVITYFSYLVLGGGNIIRNFIKGKIKEKKQKNQNSQE